MTEDDRCDLGKQVHCPMDGEKVLANRSGTAFYVSREFHGPGLGCTLCIRHLEGDRGLPIKCDGSNSNELLSQLHMMEK